MEEIIKNLKEWVAQNYKPHKCGWTYERSQGNDYDCFDDGQESQRSLDAYDIGMILGMDLEEPEEPDEEY